MSLLVKNKPKTVDALMKYLRENKKIAISGSSQKRKLRNIGYYHGYKGYRYITKPQQQVAYNDFEQLLAVYDFDAKLKALFYPCVMQIETALKNYALEVVIDEAKSGDIVLVYTKLLDNYRIYQNTKNNSSKMKNALKDRLHLRNRIYKVQSDAYDGDNMIAQHFLNKESNLPVWALFELLSLGEFGKFVSCLNWHCRANLSANLGIPACYDTGALLPQRLIYITKDLRNAIAHNDIIFDTRFKSNHTNNQIAKVIEAMVGIKGLRFDTIVDYLILLIFQMKLIKVSRTDMKHVVGDFDEIVQKLRRSIPMNIYSRIIHTDYKVKLAMLKKYIAIND